MHYLCKIIYVYLYSAKNLIKEFEKKNKLLKQDVYDNEDKSNKENEAKIKDKKTIEKIIELFEIDGVAKFLVKYKDDSKNEYVEAKKLNLSHPQLVIQFYEARIYIEKKDKKLKKAF